jgi:Ca2+-binding RTX toxin-like protein
MPTVWGTNKSETLDQADGATNFADTIFGLGGNDKLWGLNGNDWLKGGGGADELHGGFGVDWADYTDSTAGVTIDLWFGHGYGGTAEGDTFWSIENVWGSGYHDQIGGDNAVNHLYGAGGVDWLQGRGGGDYLDGGDNIDIANYWYSPEAVFINISAGTAFGGDAEGDTLVNIEGLGGSAFNDVLIGDDQVSNLMGYDGADTLKGAGGDDWLEGGAGGDTMIGGPGNDYYYVGDISDDVIEEVNGGNNDAVYAQISYTLADNVENMVLTGDLPTTGIGNALGNHIQGNEAANLINGNGGQDHLWGHGGGDFFVWGSTSHTGTSEATADLVMDFDSAQGDRIVISGIDADVYTAGNQAFTFIGTNAFSGTPGEINYVQANGNTYIQLQTGTAVDVEAVICIEGIVTPQANWFML